MNTRFPVTIRGGLGRLRIFNCAIIFMGVMWSTAYAAEKNFDIRFSPLAILVGTLDMEVSFKINENTTIGPMITYLSSKTDIYYDNGRFEEEIQIIGLRAYFYLDGAFKSGPYVSPMFRQHRIKITDHIIGASGELKVNQWGATVGYLWQGDTINFSLGLGFAANSADDIKLTNGQGSIVYLEDNAGGPLLFDLALGISF